MSGARLLHRDKRGKGRLCGIVNLSGVIANGALSAIAARITTRNQDPSIGQQSRRMQVSIDVHRCSLRKCPCLGIVNFRASVGIRCQTAVARCVQTSYHEHSSILQQRRREIVAMRLDHCAGRQNLAAGRIVQLDGRRQIRATDDQHTPIVEGSRRHVRPMCEKRLTCRRERTFDRIVDLGGTVISHDQHLAARQKDAGVNKSLGLDQRAGQTPIPRRVHALNGADAKRVHRPELARRDDSPWIRYVRSRRVHDQSGERAEVSTPFRRSRHIHVGEELSRRELYGCIAEQLIRRVRQRNLREGIQTIVQRSHHQAVPRRVRRRHIGDRRQRNQSRRKV